MSLEQLIIKCRQQDVKAQGTLYELYASKLFTLCLKYSKNYEEAEDNLQDAFLTILKKIEQYKSNGSFEGWMKRIVINTALQRYRKESVLDVIKDEIESVFPDYSVLTHKEQNETLYKIMQSEKLVITAIMFFTINN